jgi:Mn2+/Fe2+ NRAMP family transporter
VTEFIGVSLSLGYFGVAPRVSVPIAAVALIAITVSGSFRFWERAMFVFVFGSFLVIPLFFIAHPIQPRPRATSAQTVAAQFRTRAPLRTLIPVPSAPQTHALARWLAPPLTTRSYQSQPDPPR